VGYCGNSCAMVVWIVEWPAYRDCGGQHVQREYVGGHLYALVTESNRLATPCM